MDAQVTNQMNEAKVLQLSNDEGNANLKLAREMLKTLLNREM